jgi:hypothetical protein
MRRTLVLLVIASIVSLGIDAKGSTQVSPVASTVDDNSWQQLQELKRGTRLRITTASGAEIDGRLSEITPQALSLERIRLRKGDLASVQGVGTEGTTVKFTRNEIVQARAERSKHLGRWIGIGAAAAGILILLSPAGQCLLAGSSCS